MARARRNVLAVVLLCLAAAWLTLHSPTIFFDNQILLGSSLGVFALLQFGWRGLPVGVASALCTIPMWGHPWAALIMVLLSLWQLLFLTRFSGSRKERGNGRIVLATIVYWLLLGLPLTIVLYTSLLQADWASTLALGYKEAVVGVVNAGLGLLFYLGVQLCHRRAEISLRGLVFATSLLLISLPGVLTIMVMGQQITDQAFLQFRRSLEQQVQVIAFELPAGSNGIIPTDSTLRQRFPELAFEARGADGQRLISDPTLFQRLEQEYRPEPIIPAGSGDLSLLVPPGPPAVLQRVLRGYWSYGVTLPPSVDTAWRQLTVLTPAGKDLQHLYDLMRPSLQLLGLLLIAAALISEGLTMAISSQLNRILGPLWLSPAADGAVQAPWAMPPLRPSQILELNRLVRRINAQSRRVNALSFQLRRSEQQHRLLADNALDVITITDTSGRPTYISPSIEKVRGWTVAEAMALPMDQHLTPEGCAFVIDGLQQTEEAIRRGLPLPSFRVELEQSHRNGTWIWTDVTSSCMVDETGTYIGTLLVYRDISTTKRYEQRLRHLAYRDDLTGLPNRAASLEYLSRRLDSAADSPPNAATGALVVVNLDFDRFQAVNDGFGRAVGNRVLTTAATALRHWLQPEDWLARLESDEFLVIRTLPVVDGEAARRFGQELQQALAAGLAAREDLPTHPSTSAGLALGPQHGNDPVALLQAANTALMEAKRHGQNTLRLYQQELSTRIQERLDLEQRLKQALARQELHLVFQPQMNRQGQLLGAEVLLRWTLADGNPVTPEVFIPLAEQTGLIHPIGEWVFEAACRQMASWQQMGLRLPRLAINLSPVQFERSETALDAWLMGALSRHNIAPIQLELELTETALVRDPSRARGLLQQLGSAGFRIVIDDFGTGYSSLVNLHTLPVHKLKIDKSFVQHVTEGGSERAIIDSTLVIARKLGLLTMAEGVENDAQLEALMELGCDSFQGYLLGQPMSADALAGLLHRS
jgi:diguanylate cyclase (GGDEF)-like protein/PAS domain S-box-containing protein